MKTIIIATQDISKARRLAASLRHNVKITNNTTDLDNMLKKPFDLCYSDFDITMSEKIRPLEAITA